MYAWIPASCHGVNIYPIIEQSQNQVMTYVKSREARVVATGRVKHEQCRILRASAFWNRHLEIVISA